MDKLIEAIQGQSNSESDLKQLKTTLQKEEIVFLKNLAHLDTALATLDPALHSLGYTTILYAKIQGGPKADLSSFVAQSQRLLLTCSPAQIRLVLPKFCQVCQRFAELCAEGGQPLRAIKPLRSAIKKLRSSSEQLTPLHATFVQMCLLSKCYSAALPVLEEEIFDVSSDSMGTTPRDMLLYFYYGGMVFVGLKQFKKALEFFKLVIASPAAVLSAIMVEAYKKYALVSLIVNGKVPSLPKNVSPVMQRYHKASFKEYQDFINAYATHSTDELHKCAETHAELFAKDRNLGLVKQCIQKQYRRNIQRFTQTYVTFSLQDIAQSVNLQSPKEAEKQILKMVENGEIFATINQRDGMVSFGEDPEQYNTNRMTSQLDAQIQKVIDLGRKVRSVDESIASNPMYLQKTSMSERGGRWGGEFDDLGLEGAEKPVLGKLI